LKGRGYDPGPVDGIYGRRTAGAVKQFEKAMGFLKPNGVLDGDTWTALFFV
jgi:peptidoglycan hydrolase-like protein with peptidoglycan-binding domain